MAGFSFEVGSCWGAFCAEDFSGDSANFGAAAGGTGVFGKGGSMSFGLPGPTCYMGGGGVGLSTPKAAFGGACYTYPSTWW